MEVNGNTLSVSSEIEDSSEVNKILVNAGIKVYEIKNESVGFEDFFIERLGK